MALDDLPQIDGASEHDDEAKNKLSGILSQKAGFIPREQIPDKGCDYLVELIENRLAKNWHFGVQLKSIESPLLISNGDVISYSWLTSRLGYMMRNAPIFGLLVIYDVSSQTLYYEYVEKIYQKLMERESDDWKKNDKVSVHILVSNVMDSNSAVTIHETFLKRFTNLSKMTSDYGASYDLPVLKLNFVSEYDVNSTTDIVEILRRWGLSSIAVNDLPTIYELVNRLPNSEIIQHKELSILAALSFSEAGKVADSAYYVQRALKRFTLSDGETLMVHFISLKNDYSLGTIDAKEFIKECKILLGKTDDLGNKVTLRLNVLNFELLLIKAFTNVPVELAEEISDLAEVIDKMDEATNKYYLKLWNLENLALFIGLVRTQGLNEMTVLEEFDSPLSLDKRLIAARRIVAMQELFTRELHSVDEYAKQTDNILLQAFAILLHTRSKLSMEIDLITFATDPNNLEEREKWLNHHLMLADHGFAVFMKNSMLGPAYTLLCLTFELHTIMTEWFGFDSPIIVSQLEENLKALENDLELQSFKSSILNLINRKKKVGKPDGDTHHGMKGLLQLDRGQMENLAQITIRSGKFPNAKLENMMHEMESFKLFYQRCSEPDIYPMVSKGPINIVYAIKPSFQLHNRRTGLFSLTSEDMSVLLEAWNL